MATRHVRVRRPVLSLLAAVVLGACAQGGRTALPVVAPVDGLSAQASVTFHYRTVKDQMGPALLATLHGLSQKGQRVLTYDQARDVVFGSIDDQAMQNRIKDVYTGRIGDGIKDSRGAYHRGFNVEHTWPQSMGALNEPIRSDLHHLFPVDAGVNSQRNKHPLGVPERSIQFLPDYDGSGMQSRVGYRGPTQVVFEPRGDHKGDAARAMFYVYTRYALDRTLAAKMSLVNFRQEQAILLRWHAEDPVSEKERMRHERIVKRQGNRNPFIDHPEYVARIGGFFETVGKTGASRL